MNTVAIKKIEVINEPVLSFLSACRVVSAKLVARLPTRRTRKSEGVSVAALAEGSFNEVWDNKYDAQYDTV